MKREESKKIIERKSMKWKRMSEIEKVKRVKVKKKRLKEEKESSEKREASRKWQGKKKIIIDVDGR